ncbi:MAG: twin-arginine translocation signal domain-containing protein, partial [Dehalococcoidales bacterium]
MAKIITRRDFLKYAGGGIAGSIAVLVVGKRLESWAINNPAYAATETLSLRIGDAIKNMHTHNLVNEARCYFWVYKSVDPDLPHDCPAPEPMPAPASVTITSPSSGAVIEGDSVMISVMLSNFSLVPLGSENAEGEGHIHYYLDVDIPTAQGQPAVTAAGTYMATTDTSVTWEDLEPGNHTLGVQL